MVLSGNIDPAARHDDPNHREASQPLVRTLYKLAGRADQDAARDQIAYIVSQFVSFQQLQGPFLQVFEAVAKTAAKYPEIEREATALRQTISDREVAVEVADARAADAEGRLAEALLNIEQQRAQIGELARERDGARSLKEKLVDRETALAETSHRADELLAALQAAQAELGAREAALQRSELEVHDRDVGALAMQSEIAALREALKQTERAGHERARTQDALQAEVAALWDALAQADREAQERADRAEGLARERATAAAALQAEIFELQSRLTVARQVGKAAMAAFRIDTTAPTELDGCLRTRF
jgi:chromosome segregation ATPase